MLIYYLSNVTLEAIWNLLVLLLKVTPIKATETGKYEHSISKKNIRKKNEEAEVAEWEVRWQKTFKWWIFNWIWFNTKQ